MIDLFLVEDDPSHVELVRDTFGDDLGRRVTLTHAGTLDEATRRLAGASFDVLLLDLFLPDSAGLETFTRVQAAAPDLPIVVLTALDDESLATKLLQRGAQDYLVKGNADGELFLRTLRYAIERKRAERQLIEKDAQLKRAEAEARTIAGRLEQQERELHALERLTRLPFTQETARTYGLASLRESAPGVFADLTRSYRELLDQAIEERTHKVENRVSDGLRSLADRLGFLKAGPRDVIELHRLALQPQSGGGGGPRVQGYVEVGRLLVLELMGYLVSYYRNYSVGARRPGRVQ